MKFKQFLSGMGAIVLVSATLAGPANAAVSVVSHDTLTGLPFDGGSRQFGTSRSIFGDYSHSLGVQFTAAATGYIDSLTLAVYGANSGIVTIYSDNGSNMLGTALETLSIVESTNPYTYATGSYASGVTLQQGEKYWVLAVAPINAPLQRWNTVNYVDAGPHYNFIGISNCCVQEVTSGSYVSPNSVNGFALKVTIASAVPEPATWAMFITGFGMIGAASRRKARARAGAGGPPTASDAILAA